MHRHELPVTDQAIEIVHDDNDLLVVNKPASIPVHPCGRYRHNTIIFILAKEYGYKNLHTVHRLDRLTSGILIFTKTAHKSREMETLISGRQVRKRYLCRVNGEFPEKLDCEQPIKVISYKIGVCVVADDGKPCRTEFERISYKDGVSILSCRPFTGRMHQIRVHLQYLGFPIANDPLYNSDAFGPRRGKYGDIGKTEEELISDLIQRHSAQHWIESSEADNDTTDADQASLGDVATSGRNDESVGKEGNDHENSEPCDRPDLAGEYPVTDPDTEDRKYYDEHCIDCKRSYKDPPKDTMFIYLHALQYSGDGWEYKTSPPSWTNL